MTRVYVSKMERPEHHGDWHDKPLKWKTEGPEVQKFATRAEAELYAKFRRRLTFIEAQNAFVLGSL